MLPRNSKRRRNKFMIKQVRSYVDSKIQILKIALDESRGNAERHYIEGQLYAYKNVARFISKCK